MITNVNGASLAYWDVGHGIPLLCLHGGMGIDSHCLRVPGILDLANHGVRLIIHDQRGHGDSSRSPEREYTNELWASDAHALASGLNLPRHALLGHSYGGFLALEYAVRWPESLSHLVLVSTSAGPVITPRSALPTDEDVRERFRGVWSRFFAGSHKHWDVFQSLRFSSGPYNAAFLRELPAYDLGERVKDLRVPALLVVGASDYYLRHMESLARTLPNATLCVMDGVGHFPFLESPTEFIACVSTFLKKSIPQPSAFERSD